MGISIADNFNYQASKPLDSRIKYDTLSAMKSAVDATLYDGCMAYCVATDKYYKWLSSNTVDTDLGKWREFSAGGSFYTAGDGINIDENNEISTDNLQSGDIADCIYPSPTPTPGVTSLGGLTDVALTDPTNGQALIYNSTTHAWENGEGGGGGTTYTAGDGIVIDQNNEISTDDLQSGDMDDILDTLPSIKAPYEEYSTTEHVIGKWIDGSDLYEKTVEISSPTTNTFTTVQSGVAIGFIANGTYLILSNGSIYTGPLFNTSSDYLYISSRVLNNTLQVEFQSTAAVSKLIATVRYTKS